MYIAFLVILAGRSGKWLENEKENKKRK